MQTLQRNPATAKEAAAALVAARAEYNRLAVTNTASMINEARAQLDAYAAKWRAVIIADTIADFNRSLNSYQSAERAASVAEANTGARWDAKRMVHERAFADGDIRLALKSTSDYDGGQAAALETALNRARLVGDPHRRKAQLEAIAAAAVDASAKREAHTIQQSAARELAAMEMTPELASAQKKQSAAGESLRTAYGDLQTAAAAVGESVGGVFDVGTLAQAARRVQFGWDGSIAVYAENSPEVTGVSMR